MSSCVERGLEILAYLCYTENVFFFLFLTILSWANFRNICSENMTLKKINNRPLSLYN